MTAFRLGSMFTIAHLVLGLLVIPPVSLGDDVSVRKAATTSSTPPLSRVTGQGSPQSGTAQTPTRIGLAPLPFRPDTPQERHEEHLAQRVSLPDLRNIVKKVNRSVVAIRMLDASSKFSLGSLGFSGESGGKALGYGTGFLVSSNGYIMTNEHVLRNGSRIEVELVTGEKYQAQAVLKDPKNDLALLKIDANNCQPVEFGDSDAVELGEWVMGIGNPYGIGQSLMIGVVSARNRTIPGSGYPPLIQIDAAMNLGNSGGPLFNMNGQVIGINTILLWKSQGIGFATPINIAKDFLQRHTRPRAKPASAPSPTPGPDEGERSRAMLTPPFHPLDPPWKADR